MRCILAGETFFFWAGYKFYSSTMNNSKIRQEGLGLGPSLASRNLTRRGRQGGDGNRPRPHNETLQLTLTCKLGKTLINKVPEMTAQGLEYTTAFVEVEDFILPLP